jgi:tricorn protease-like protein
MKTGLLLCFTSLFFFSYGQSGSEIYLFDLKIADGQVIISNGKNITNHKGYDNQPFFHPSRPIIYYSSFDDSSRSDIRYYNYETKETKNLTTTHEREYSPTVTPDGRFISCILQRDNGAQDLVRYPIEGGKPEVLVWHLKVGYHAWVGEKKVFLYVLDDSIHTSLHNYEVSTNIDTVIAENIGRSLQPIPAEEALSYVQKLVNKQNVIKRYVIATGVSSPIIFTVPGQDFFCWTQANPADQKKFLLAGDGSKLFFSQDYSATEFKDKVWTPMVVEGNSSMLKGVSRLAVSADNTKLAVVVNE